VDKFSLPSGVDMLDRARRLRVAAIRITLLSLIVGGSAFAQVAYDVVIRGGRVIDPETSLDAVRDIGIRGNRIAAVSEQALSGSRVIAASGLIIAPGFIDLHDHDPDCSGLPLKGDGRRDHCTGARNRAA
jgi:hypothetical protein